ncbi:hypothetical protein EMPS_07046 [Entomortierella parvispora]|uniref:PPM-type phosphatase domain-containing protein n=1 Tax=Entomortierella parvispora TaxID=205924 RepID=A0A9P3HE57_9FUNG|nr:hypothetical protein EMPS_07046 [Entomortierella parvispora]
MTVPESKSRPLTSVSIVDTTTQTKVHSFVRQNPVSLASFQASQEDAGRGDHNGRVSVQPTSFEGGLLVGLYDPHHGPQCAEYLQQHLVPILDESLSTQLDHQDDSNISGSIQNLADIDSTSGTSACKIDPNQVIDTLKSTFLELDELLLATAITVALTQPEDVDLASADEVKKAQEVLAQVVTGSTALVGFLAPHQSFSETSLSVALAEVAADAAAQGAGDVVQKLDLYLAQLGDSVAILAGLDHLGQWTARRLNPPETHEHSVRYPHSDEFRKVVSEAKDRALTAEQFFRQSASSFDHNDSSNNTHTNAKDNAPEMTDPEGSFLTRGGKFLGLPVTRAFGDLDWKIEQDPRHSVATWVEASLKAQIERTLRQQHEANLPQEQVGINNLNDPPYVAADPRITRYILQTRKRTSIVSASGASDQLLILLNRGFLYSTHITPSAASSSSSSTQDKVNNSGNPYDQQLISDLQLSRVVADTLEKGEENAALAVARALDQARKELGVVDCEGEEGHEGSVLVVVL